MKMQENRQYGFLNELSDNGPIRQIEGQIPTGGSIGILCLDGIRLTVLPGNVMNGYTYDFPVQYLFIKGLDNHTLFTGKDELYDKILETSLELKKYGVRAITAVSYTHLTLPTIA